VSWKSFVLNTMWVVVSFLLILLFSTQDKEWFIDGQEIKNICDLMKYIESEDIRLVGVFITLPLFIPFVYAVVWKKQRNLWQWLIILFLLSFWLWRFIFRYQFCF